MRRAETYGPTLLWSGRVRGGGDSRPTVSSSEAPAPRPTVDPAIRRYPKSHRDSADEAWLHRIATDGPET
jgi:hypothetical protein